jgi:hypothetical protein
MTNEEQKILKCWHILPYEEENAEIYWWVLGPSNRADEKASMAGPYDTKEEAFNLALEHNKRAYGIEAVYVHGRGKEADGDFEYPAEKAWEDKVREVGNLALQATLDGLKEKEAPPPPKLHLLVRILAYPVAAVWLICLLVRYLGRRLFSISKRVVIGIGTGLMAVLMIVLGLCSPLIAPFALGFVLHMVFPDKPAEQEEQSKKDCMIVATEAYNRLRAQGVWAEIVGFKVQNPEGEKMGHAVCVYQVSARDNLFAYDQHGTLTLNTKSADIRMIERAYNEHLKNGWKATDFEVLAQEPAKATPVRRRG